MSTARIEEAICAHICERETSDPASYADLFNSVFTMLSPGVHLDQILAEMVGAGKIETFVDDQRGTIYVRDC